MSITYTFHDGPPGKDYDENQIKMTGYKINKIKRNGSQWSQIISLDVSDMRQGERITHVVMWHHSPGGRHMLQALSLENWNLEVENHPMTLVATINLGISADLVLNGGIP